MTITEIEVETEIRRLAKENPDNIYYRDSDLCYYTRGNCLNGSVGCIVGQALMNLGVPKGLLAKEDQDDETIGAASLLHRLAVKPSGRQNFSDWLVFVQMEQDFGGKWGQAVASADREAGINHEEG